MRFDDRFLEELKSRLRPSDVVGKTVKLRRQGREYAQLTPKARASWVKVVKHNRLDLEGMQLVLQAITAPWFGAEGQV